MYVCVPDSIVAYLLLLPMSLALGIKRKAFHNHVGEEEKAAVVSDCLLRFAHATRITYKVRKSNATTAFFWLQLLPTGNAWAQRPPVQSSAAKMKDVSHKYENTKLTSTVCPR